MSPPALNIGTRVALAGAVATVCVAGAIGLLVHRITAADQLATARTNLDRQLTSAAYDRAVIGLNSSARLNPPDLPGPVATTVRGNARVTFLQDGPHPMLWAATRISDRNVLALSRPYTPENRSLARLDRTLLTVASTATLLVSLAGLLLGVRMGSRATVAARTAERIAENDLEARVRPSGQDEIARLAASVNAMANALGALLEAERRVTADIAHELRTPAGRVDAEESEPLPVAGHRVLLCARPVPGRKVGSSERVPSKAERFVRRAHGLTSSVCANPHAGPPRRHFNEY
ncbi:HAMP domain-containing protein [Streptomyces mirabilis]